MPYPIPPDRGTHWHSNTVDATMIRNGRGRTAGNVEMDEGEFDPTDHNRANAHAWYTEEEFAPVDQLDGDA